MPKALSVGRENLSIAIQAVILFLAFFLGIEAWLDNSMEQRRQAFSESCLLKIQDLAVKSDPELYLKSRVFRLLTLFRKNRLPGLAKIHEQYKRIWGFHLAMYRFSGTGELLESAPENPPNLWLMKTAYKGLVSRDSTFFEAIRKQTDKKIPFVFGDGKDLMSLKTAKGDLIDIFAGGETGCLAWDSSSGGGLIVHCSRNPDETEIFRRALACSPEAEFPLVGFGHQGTIDFMRSGEAPDPEAARVWDGFREKKCRSGTVDDHDWFFQETSSARILYGAFPRFGKEEPRFRAALRTGGLAFAGFLFLLLWRFRLTSSLNLRRILVGLFLAAALVPLFGIAIGSLDLMQVYETVAGTRIAYVQNQAILGLISGFEDFLVDSGRKLVEAVRNPGSGVDPGRVNDIMKRIRRKGFPGRVTFRDPAGNLLFSNVKEYSSDTEILNRSFARSAISKHAPARLGEKPYRENVVTDSVVRADDLGFNDVSNARGELQMVNTGVESNLFFFQAYPENIGGTAYLEVKFPVVQGVVKYLREKAAQRITFRDLSLKFYSFDLSSLRWAIPPPEPLKTELTRIALRSWMSGQAETRHLKTAGNSGFAVALFSPKLARQSLVAFCSDSPLESRIRSSLRMVFACGLVFSLLLIILARGISNNLVRPLKELGGGAEALINRRFDFRLGLAGENEMGSLFRAFNDMMNESHDLQVAKQVQEGLIPSVFPKVPGYSLEGKIFMASDLGGDCLDCFSLKDGRVVFLVGDVTGHGVGSALLMAFARAVTFHWSQGTRLSPAVLAGEIDLMLKRRESKSFMGAICGILDPVAHTLEVNVEGHVFPLLLRKDGSSRWVGKSEFPLGVGRKPKSFPTSVIRLEPGDCLLCSTDGFIEALNDRKEPVGFERFGIWANETRCNQASLWIERMITRHREWNREQLDDLTIFAMIRSDGGPK